MAIGLKNGLKNGFPPKPEEATAGKGVAEGAGVGVDCEVEEVEVGAGAGVEGPEEGFKGDGGTKTPGVTIGGGMKQQLSITKNNLKLKL